jgi:ApbE superfamily uncharacterized protein (UPF0280 family)
MTAKIARYKSRDYRRWVKSGDLVGFRVVERETDLLISADKDMTKIALESTRKFRRQVENYIERHRTFLTSLSPVDTSKDAPQIVRQMAYAGKRADVGPMAAVAGAIAQFVGNILLRHSEQVIVENGGDIFLKTNTKRLIGIYAGDSPFTGRLRVEIDACNMPVGVCTSSGTVGHSLSFGAADAVTILSKSALIGDAAATAVCNAVKGEEDIDKGIELGKRIKGILGLLIIVGDKLGVWGDVKLA